MHYVQNVKKYLNNVLLPAAVVGVAEGDVKMGHIGSTRVAHLTNYSSNRQQLVHLGTTIVLIL